VFSEIVLSNCPSRDAICTRAVERARSSVIATLLQAGRSLVRIPIRSLDFLIYIILLVALVPGVHPASNRSIKIMFLGSKVRWVRRAHNLTAIYEPIV
jgi:hypothetical protein